MASERQIAANRRNAQKSTGPRSAAGSKRASRNAYRHGLSIPRSGAGFIRAVEELACSLVREGADASALELAREAARGMLELDRVRRIAVALIARVLAFGRLEPAKIFASQKDELAWVLQHFLGAKLWKSRPKFAIDRLPEMPTDEPQRSAEAVRRALPSLLQLRRYEVRAVAERDRAVRALVAANNLNLGHAHACKTNPISI